MTLSRVRAAVGDTLRETSQIAEPIHRAHDAIALLRIADNIQRRAAGIRAEAWRELRTEFGWSLGDLAKEYHVTRARAAQITGHRQEVAHELG